MICPWELKDVECKHERALDQELRTNPGGIAKTCIRCKEERDETIYWCKSRRAGSVAFSR